jgi:ArsR family transcriptional regulator
MPLKKDKPGGERPMQAMMAPISEKSIRELSNVFKLLSDEGRLRILAYLAQNNELHVSDLCERLGQSQPAVSHHLALLRVSGLIEPRREGKHIYYSVRTEVFGELLLTLLSATGEMPKKVRFHDFTLTHQGR